MPKVNERERIAALEAKLKQLKVVQQRKEARAQSDSDVSTKAGQVQVLIHRPALFQISWAIKEWILP
jgi:predicted O-linked N-acetylglucosamine transferase (SPINDLY family)